MMNSLISTLILKHVEKNLKNLVESFDLSKLKA